MELSLTDLPADVLLSVMQYVDVSDLLSCRLVCKRIGGLALHPDAWRHQCLYHNSHPRYAPQALRLAPYLMALELDLEDLAHRLTLALCSATNCAVTQLEIMLTTKRVEFELAGRVIRRQAALGRLRRLKLTLTDTFYRIPDVEVMKLLATTVISTSGLEQLQIDGFTFMHPNPDTPLLLAGPAPSASIKALGFTLTPATEPFVSFVLAAHAATLERVTLCDDNRRFGVITSRSIAALLAGMPNLRELACDPLTGLQAVATCKSLRQFSLLVHDAGGRFDRYNEVRRRNLLDAKEFLHRADQLESVLLEYQSVFPDVGPSVLSLSPRSRLQRLVIHDDRPFEQDSENSHLQPLLAALPSLTALHHLELHAAVDGLAGAVTTVTAPALRTLKLLTVAGRGKVCGHAFLHSSSVLSLVADNPALELGLEASWYDCHTSRTCQACRWGCHKMSRWDYGTWHRERTLYYKWMSFEDLLLVCSISREVL